MKLEMHDSQRVRVTYEPEEADVRAVTLMMAFLDLTAHHSDKSLVFSTDTLNVIRAVLMREVRRLTSSDKVPLPAPSFAPHFGPFYCWIPGRGEPSIDHRFYDSAASEAWRLAGKERREVLVVAVVNRVRPETFVTQRDSRRALD